jgi:hypothetical protein
MAKGKKNGNIDPLKKIYNNAQELTAMIFGQDLSTDDEKKYIDNLLSSYQVESGGGYTLKDGVYTKKTPETVFDSDRFFKDMDDFLGFGQGDFEGVTTASMTFKPEIGTGNNKKSNPNFDLIGKQLKDRTMIITDGNNIPTSIFYGDKKTLNAQNQEYTPLRKEVDRIQKKQAKEAQKEANKLHINKGDQKLEEIINDPSLLLKEKSHRQRQIADRAYQHSLYGAQFSGKGDMPKFLDRTSSLSLTDKDFLFKIDASDELITDVYKNVTENVSWQDTYIKQKYDAGLYKDKYDFSAKKASDLSDEQFQMLKKDFETEELANFKSSFDNFDALDVDSTKTVPGAYYRKGPFVAEIPNVDVGVGQERPFSPEAARRNYMLRNPEIFNGIDPNSKAFNTAFDNAIKKTEAKEQQDALQAYRRYAQRTFKEGKTTRVQSAQAFMKEQFSVQNTEQSVKLLNNELNGLKGLGHDGIKAASKFKGLKVAGGIAGGLVALWALSETYDE